jgi:hypothetical protein
MATACITITVGCGSGSAESQSIDGFFSFYVYEEEVEEENSTGGGGGEKEDEEERKEKERQAKEDEKKAAADYGAGKEGKSIKKSGDYGKAPSKVPEKRRKGGRYRYSSGQGGSGRALLGAIAYLAEQILGVKAQVDCEPPDSTGPVHACQVCKLCIPGVDHFDWDLDGQMRGTVHWYPDGAVDASEYPFTPTTPSEEGGGDEQKNVYAPPGQENTDGRVTTPLPSGRPFWLRGSGTDPADPSEVVQLPDGEYTCLRLYRAPGGAVVNFALSIGMMLQIDIGRFIYHEVDVPIAADEEGGPFEAVEALAEGLLMSGVESFLISGNTLAIPRIQRGLFAPAYTVAFDLGELGTMAPVVGRVQTGSWAFETLRIDRTSSMRSGRTALAPCEVGQKVCGACVTSSSRGGEHRGVTGEPPVARTELTDALRPAIDSPQEISTVHSEPNRGPVELDEPRGVV